MQALTNNFEIPNCPSTTIICSWTASYNKESYQSSHGLLFRRRRFYFWNFMLQIYKKKKIQNKVEVL